MQSCDHGQTSQGHSFARIRGGCAKWKLTKSRQNPKIQRVKKLGSDRTFRRREGVFVCDGEKLLFEAVKNGAGIETVFTWDAEARICTALQEMCTPLTGSFWEYMSPVKAPQKVLFTCSIRPVPEKRAEKTRYVLLEGVQDPGNLGTIIRTANALNYGKVLRRCPAVPIGITQRP